MIQNKLHFCIVLILLFGFISKNLEARRNALPIQGYFSDLQDVPLEGLHSLTIRLYKTCADSEALITQVEEIEIQSGLYQSHLSLEALGPQQIEEINNQESLCVGIQLDGDEEMLPRLEYDAVPYARLSESADIASYAAIAGALQSLGNGLKVRNKAYRSIPAPSILGQDCRTMRLKYPSRKFLPAPALPTLRC